MQDLLNAVLFDMIEYEAGQPKHIQHLIKVHDFARLIGQTERLDDTTQLTLELAALVHDIGINPSRAKYNSSAGRYQEIEGPPKARQLLSRYDLPCEMIDRVCYLVGHHHTYTQIDGLDYRILVEADFLVNLYEDGSSRGAIEHALARCFQTQTGIKLLKTMFL